MAKTVKVSDYIAHFITTLDVRQVFMISGGGNMQIVDSIGREKKLHYFCMHHEQSLAMAAEAYTRVESGIGVVVLTTGPSGTNALTGVAGAWLDSTPMLIISGQVKTSDMIPSPGLRQFGVQELPVTDIAAPITKYAVVVKKPSDIAYELERATELARTPRCGPVWIDVPLDVQSAQIDPDKLKHYKPPKKRTPNTPDFSSDVTTVVRLLKKSSRPILYVGNGVRLSGAQKDFLKLVDTLGVPVQTAWNGNDLIGSDHPLFFGRPGSFGMRYANFVLQNCDFFLSIGARLSVPQMGYDFSAFAPHATKVVVDVDRKELDKPSLKNFDLKIQADAGDFIEAFLNTIEGENTRSERLGMSADKRSQGDPLEPKIAVLNPNIHDWLSYCTMVKRRFPTVTKEQQNQKKFVNSYVFIDQLSSQLNARDVIITDMGTSFTCTAQVFRVKLGQRYFTSSGLASMGFGLPGAIGAALGSKRRTICISGDGGLQMNIQELQTVIQNKLNLKLFVINNRSYLTIRETQRNFFNSRFIASSQDSGVSCPDIKAVAGAYGLPTFQATNHKNLTTSIKKTLSVNGPAVCEILMDPTQQLIPKLTSTLNKNGKFQSNPLHNMYPFLKPEKLKELMISEL